LGESPTTAMWRQLRSIQLTRSAVEPCQGCVFMGVSLGRCLRLLFL
jgi:hypothetical protein